MNNFLQLIINPGSTSTKIAVYKDDTPIFEKTLIHSVDDIRKFQKIIDQYNFRKEAILHELHVQAINMQTLNAVVARGGILKPLEGGTYLVSERMLTELRASTRGDHESNLGALIADEIASQIGIKAFIVDPVAVDELEPMARFSGHPSFERKSIFHALNQKSVARIVAAEMDRTYEECNFIVAHLGGGVSIGSHRRGRVVDVNNSLDGEGPFSSERSGTLPSAALVELCFSKHYTKEKIYKMIKGKGGLAAYMGTTDAKKIDEAVASGDEKALQILQVLGYQVAKSIGAGATVLEGEVDKIIITGGLARCSHIVDEIIKRVQFISPVVVYPGENELYALAAGGLRVLSGEESAKEYK